jgi:hypothetical protein
MNGLTLILFLSSTILLVMAHNRLKNVKLYHALVKRPICRVNVRMKRSFSTALSDEEKADRKIMMKRQDISYSDYSDNPYEKMVDLPIQGKLKFCQHKIREIRKRAFKYYPYTNGRLKREDIYELCIYKREIEKIETKIAQHTK